MNETPLFTPKGQGRPLTTGEQLLARSLYKDALDLSSVQIRRSKWAFFQPRHVAMAPTGHIHFHPDSELWSEDYSKAGLALAGLFLHELCHVWQTQRGVYLPLARHPFCRYHYTIKPGWKLPQYGLEQQAEIVRHTYLLREGYNVPGAPSLSVYESILTTLR